MFYSGFYLTVFWLRSHLGAGGISTLGTNAVACYFTRRMDLTITAWTGV
jgi:hypothetical protein